MQFDRWLFNRWLFNLLGGALVCVVLPACNKHKDAVLPVAQAPTASPKCTENCTPPVVSKEAKVNFQSALDAFVKQDLAGSWTPDSCTAVAAEFAEALAQQERDKGAPIPEAHYNAGLAFQRCSLGDQAKLSFEAAYKLDNGFHRARAQLVLYEFKETGILDQAILQLDQIIRDAQFQNAGGLVALASLQMMRNSANAGPNCESDLDCAQLNLQRALALDDSFMPAFNQLALYYLEQARGDSSSKRNSLVVASSFATRLNKQRLDLASLVASQALQKNPNYAPIHNTIGLIQVELGNYNGAVKSFSKARSINPNLFESQMNYAAVNLSFRGFGEAAAAYNAALSLRPQTYEAHLGLALALRGMITEASREKNLAEVQNHLNEAKRLEPNRAEAYYNEAILTEEFRAKQAGAGKEQVAMWKEQISVFGQAATQYQAFVDRAEGEAQFQDAVAVARSRIDDINATLAFMEESIQMSKPPEGN